MITILTETSESICCHFEFDPMKISDHHWKNTTLYLNIFVILNLIHCSTFNYFEKLTNSIGDAVTYSSAAISVIIREHCFNPRNPPVRRISALSWTTHLTGMRTINADAHRRTKRQKVKPSIWLTLTYTAFNFKHSRNLLLRCLRAEILKFISFRTPYFWPYF